MTCLDRIISGEMVLIGIKDWKHCSNPSSGLYINDIPGLSIKTLAASANEEQKSAYTLAQDKILLATKLVIDDSKDFLMEGNIFNSVIDNVQAGEFFDTGCDQIIRYNPMAPLFRGLCAQRIGSKMARLVLKELQILSNTTQTVRVFYDDAEVTTFDDVDVVAGVRKVLIMNKRFNSEKIYIKINNSNIETAQGETNFNVPGCVSCGGSRSMKNIAIWGWDGQGISNQMFGINAKINLECDETEFVCGVIERMYIPIWLRSGIEIYKEIMVSNRLNPIINNNKENAKEMLPVLNEEYAKKYQTFCQTIIGYLKSFNDVCITCNKNSYGTQLP